MPLHLQRYFEVQGYQTQRICLKHSWPPPSHAGMTLEILKEVLKKQAADEKATFNLKNLEGKKCWVLSQGGPRAQGPDVMVVVNHGEKVELWCFRCKNVKTSPGAGTVSTEWWPSLGVGFANGVSTGAADFRPEQPKEVTEHNPAYSYMGMDAFRTFISELLEEEVVFGKRIIATSLSLSERADFSFPTCAVEEQGSACVWFREMLEPTISVLAN